MEQNQNLSRTSENWFFSVKLALLTFLPIFLFWYFREFIGIDSIWVFFDHIEVLYYVSGIEVAQGFPPSNVDNPGTPIQLISFVLVHLLGENPEYYEQFIFIAHLLLLALNFIASVFLIRYSNHKIDWQLKIAGIWLFFAFSVSLTYLRVFGPEPFYYIFGAASLTFLFSLAKSPDEKTLLKLFFFGASIGLLISTKFTFLAWLPGLSLVAVLVANKMVSTESLRNLIVSLGGVFIAFFLITSSVSESYSYMFEWVLGNISRDGSYGSGNTMAPNLSVAVENWGNFIKSNRIWIAILLLIIVFTIKNQFFSKSDLNNKSRHLLFAFAMTSIFFSLLTVMRSYQHRYMLPIGLCGVVLFYNYAPLLSKKSIIKKSFFTCAVLTLLIKAMINEYNTHKHRILSSQSLMNKLNIKLEIQIKRAKVTNPVIIYGWRMGHPALSLRQHPVKGNYLEKVDMLYPDTGHYTPWLEGGKFRLPKDQTHWDFAIIRDDTLENIKGASFQVVDYYQNYHILKSVK